MEYERKKKTMTGVEILATEEVAIAWGFDWIGFWCVLVLCLFMSAFWVVFQFLDGSYGFGIFLALFAITVSLIAGLIVGHFSNDGAPTEYETHYKVTISDEVPMNEFLERYEIIERDGKIYTVREVKE